MTGNLNPTNLPPFSTDDKEVAMISAALYLVVSIGDSGTEDRDTRLEYYLERFEKAYKSIKTTVESS